MAVTFSFVLLMADRKTENSKKQTKDKNKNNGFYNTVIAQRAARELDAREKAFEEEHQNDKEYQLLDYFHECARQLGHTPRIKEIEGWKYLEKRFGTWDILLIRAGMRRYFGRDPESEYALIKNERDRQMELHREKKRQKKIRAAQRLKEQAQKKKAQEAYLAAHPEARKRKKRKKSSQAQSAQPSDRQLQANQPDECSLNEKN